MNKQLVIRVATLGVLFWIIKIFSTTVGETAADYISTNLKLGLTLTTIIMGVVTVVVPIGILSKRNIFHHRIGF